jgi:hypothetical protein
MVESKTTTISGTPKQIAWAEKIRAEYMAQIAMLESRADERFGVETAHEATFHRQTLAQMRTEAESQAAAKWWIDGRDETAVDRFRDLNRELAGLPAIEE